MARHRLVSLLAVWAVILGTPVCRAQSAVNAWAAPATTEFATPASFLQSAQDASSTQTLPSLTTNLPPAAPPASPLAGADVEELIGPSNVVSPADPSSIAPTISASPLDWGVWISPVDWDGSFEVGVNGTEGNAQSLSFRTGGNLKRKKEQWEQTMSIIYAKTVANGQETQHNAIFNSGYEFYFKESPWTHFGKMYLEYDEFQSFDLRVVMNAGLGYKFIATDTVKLKGRSGAGVSHEIGSPDERWVPEADFGVDYSHQISKRQKVAIVGDYYPEWQDFNNYRMVTSLVWEMLLDDASNLNLKLSVNDRYDSTPNGKKPNDVIYSLLLLWKI